ncbi:DUF5658 family protein [Psychrobacillus sp. NPDC058041]|uniref:DUF5658 family protein n=1 Tax=Psychrobacillus sp. NPDC058041 TaxID=3346310 RepID=UPI0036DDE6A8
MIETKQILFSYTKPTKAATILLILAILDSIFTDFGIRNNHITEANPIMRVIYESSILGFYAIKIFLPLLLIYITTKLHLKKIIQLLIGATLLIYTYLLAQHIYWLSLIISK